MRRLVVMCIGPAFVVAACGSSSGSKSAPSSTSTTNRTTTSTVGACTGAGWADVTETWKVLAPGPFATSPQQVAEDLAALRRGQDTSEVGQVSVAEVRSGEPLVIVLAETGVPDVAVTRVETEVTLEGGDQGWAVSSARQRSICAGRSS
jgi:hypothetical protein